MLYIKGMFKNLLPILILGSELRTGMKLSNAQGYYRLYKEPTGYFKRYFPNQKVITSVIKDVINRYDNALESLMAQEKFPFNEEKYAEELFEQIKKDTYTTSPNTAFLIKKKNGVERMVEQLDFRDLIAQQYILKTISEVFDRMFEEGSLGFRKGISRQKSVRNGYVLKGKRYERIKGLAQGSPLSPILVNLYLDSFDEQIKQWDVKMIRYADDFIILAKTKEEAENVLSRTETLIKPDSKRYYDISFEQGRRYNSLTDTEILCIAKEFAAGKINNYISFFKQKYVKDQNLFIGELERVVKYIYQAGDLNEVRGYEGSTAKKIYQRLNNYIDDTISSKTSP
ncbi:MAG: hypothetical protein COY75_06780 [Nitrospirae bacterium CG_4_10_14_0_8_um_filter_41_23]|nr:MAG: hypothetical protein COS27_00135 [Nitrospirae bacterium CG02_land_8_20_14_3_00_41_53]PIW86568.1 MAG: hypothetical protein COZ94_09695 [Nitrospirae bacterium CG_4_8_14_3_um_filter_41_47]PIY86687.1 MAG: hypothetical protein COY75_06780 [Nitrospirae bacterium CG_4_10_14_0_8_um_filter_41_23]